MISAAVALTLLALAALHAYWGLGGVWPGHDRKSCARAVAGFRGIDRMPPPVACFAVTVALLAAASLALVLGRPPTTALMRLAGMGAALVFLARGIAGFTPAWRRLTPELPFARNDRRFFSPLCLAIGTGFAILALRGITA